MKVGSWLAGRYELRVPLVAPTRTSVEGPVGQNTDPLGARQIWSAHDWLLNRPVIVKGLLDEQEAIHPHIREEFVRRSLLEHPRLASVYDLGVTPVQLVTGASTRFHYLTETLISGPSLRSRRGQLSGLELVSLARDCLSLLAFLHLQRLTQLDLKSDHLLRGELGWHLIDLDEARPDAPLAAYETQGTLHYLAPEVLEGSPGGPQADLYSLGILLTEAACGNLPTLPGETLEQVRQNLRTSPVPPLPDWLYAHQPSLAHLINKLMARAAAQRPESAEAALLLLDPTDASWRVTTPLPLSPLVGRETLLESLLATESAAANTHGLGCVIEGPAQSGRSRMLQALTHHWQLQGIPAFRLEPGILDPEPFAAIQVLRSFLNSLRGSLRGEVGGIEPLEAGPRTHPTVQEEAEARICSAVQHLLDAGRAAHQLIGTPIPLLIDDPNQLDEGSRATLQRLFPVLPGSGIHLIVAIQSEESPPFSLTGGQRFSLYRLEPTEIRALAEATPAVLPLSQAELTRLDFRSEGRPGWVREGLSHRWRHPDAPGWEWQSPSHAVHGQVLLESLPPDLATIACEAAVLDHPFSQELLEQVITEPLPVGALARLVGAGIFTPHRGLDDEAPPLTFAQDSVRRAFEKQLDPDLQRAGHLRAALALETQEAAPFGRVSREIALHFLAAQAPDRARPYLQHAVEDALARLCLEEALELLHHLRRITPTPSPVALDLARRQGELELELNRFSQAASTLRQGLEMHPDVPFARRLPLLACLGKALISKGELAAGMEYLEQVVEASSPWETRQVGMRIPALHLFSWACLQTGKRERARALLTSVDLTTLGRDSRLEVDHAYYLGCLAAKDGSATPEKRALLEHTFQQLDASLALAQRLEYRRGETRILNLQAELYHQVGNLAQSTLALEHLAQHARARFDLSAEASAIHNMALLALDLGDDPLAFSRFERAADLYAQAGNRAREARNRLDCANLLLKGRQLDRCEAVLVNVQRYLDAQHLADKHFLDKSGSAAGSDLHLPLSLLQLRLKMARGEAAAPGEAEHLQKALETAGKPVLALELVAARMEQALLQGDAHEALALYCEAESLSKRAYPVPSSEVRGDNSRPTIPPVAARAWDQIHALAAQAHMQLRPFASPNTSHPISTLPAKEISQPPPTSPPTPPTSSETPSSQKASIQADTFAEELAWLGHLEQLFRVSDDEEALAASLARLCGQVLNGRGLIVLFTGTGLQVVQQYGLEAETVADLSETLIERVRRSRQPLFCQDVRVDPELGQLRSLRKADVRSVICCPVMAEGQCLGVIYVDHPRLNPQTGAISVTSERTNGIHSLDVVQRVAQLCARLLQAINRRRRHASLEPDFSGLIGVSAPMRALKQWLEWIAESTDPTLTLLLLGETGTGKSLIAKAIHTKGQRREGPFETINCAAIPPSLFESQMFGHIKGAFTGADMRQEGAFERARAGTLFLDEVGEIPLIDQSKFLTVLSTRRFRLLGESREREFNSHLICATNRDLRRDADEGRFRSDLLRRIYINVYRVPTLRERGEEDIHLLTQHIITQYLVEQRLRRADEPLVNLRDVLTRDAEAVLYQHTWPWNVGELENLFRNELVRRFVRSGGQDRVPARVLREVLGPGIQTGMGAEGPARTPGKGTKTSLLDGLPSGLALQELNSHLEQLKIAYVRRALDEQGGNQTQTAAAMKTHRSVLDDIITGRRRKGREPR